MSADLNAISIADQERLRHFLALGREAQAGAVRRMAAVGHSPTTIAAATRLSEEQIRQILEDSACAPSV
ncbi:MAG: hypothetical protein WBW93_17825 [Steroidobacteraceae bacterium]